LGKPETATSLHSKEIIAIEEVINLVETKSTKIRPGWMEGRGGECSQKGPIKDIFAALAGSRNRIFSKKRNDADIYGQIPSREVLEKNI
jgi:hypothetical protein